MSALRCYFFEACRQANLLSEAARWDIDAESILKGAVDDWRSLEGAETRNHSRRIWTRQDRNRVAHQHNGKVPGRMTTRVERILRKLPALDGFHAAAIGESTENGTYQNVSLLVIELTQAHEELMELYQRESDGRPPINATELFELAEERHSNAAKALRYFVPAAVPIRNQEVPRQKKKRGKPKGKFTNRRAAYWKKHMQSDMTAEAKASLYREKNPDDNDATAEQLRAAYRSHVRSSGQKRAK